MVIIFAGHMVLAHFKSAAIFQSFKFESSLIHTLMSYKDVEHLLIKFIFRVLVKSLEALLRCVMTSQSTLYFIEFTYLQGVLKPLSLCVAKPVSLEVSSSSTWFSLEGLGVTIDTLCSPYITFGGPSMPRPRHGRLSGRQSASWRASNSK